MPCYHPMRGYRSKTVNASGKRSVVFKPIDGLIDWPIELPCGQCIGCRLEKSRQWAVRCVNEAQLYEDNSFVTLTFNNQSLGSQTSLVKSDFQKFIKRLRKSTNHKIRYFHCGEYGELLSRPHHHAIIFNHDFHDKILYSIQNEIKLYVSPTLQRLWPFGFSSIGEVNFETAAYVARYTLKKRTGKDAAEYYGDRLPPYNTMSLKPGIGEQWIQRYLSDVYPWDEVSIRTNIRCKPPKYYDQIYDRLNPRNMLAIKKRRYEGAKARAKDSTPERLEVREQLAYIRTKQLVRNYEDEK